MNCSRGGLVSCDKLLLATGASPRVLSLPGGDPQRVYYLCRIEDSQQLEFTLSTSSFITILGASWIGLEIAAAARAAGLEVVLLKRGELPRARRETLRLREGRKALQARPNPIKEGNQTMALPIAVLFDVDETLVHTGGSGARSWAWAFDQLHGVAVDIGEHSSAGETDPQVGRATFRAELGREPNHEEMARLYSKYLWHLSDDIWTADGYRVLEGAENLLGRLTEAGVILGVISGAMEGAARMKMEPGKLNRYFVFGAYGSDSPDRTEVTRFAIAKAARLHGQDLAPGEVFVVGDTPHDIVSARAAGATAVGVTTGHYGSDELQAAKADHLLRSLTEPFPGL